MPELPEVETIRRGLAGPLPGRAVKRARLLCPRILHHPDAASFERLLPGQTFGQPSRLGKYLFLPLTRHTLLIHLGMTGQVTWRDPARADLPFERLPVTGLQRTLQHPPDKHTHVVLDLQDGTQLMYRDIRKFGRWRLYEPRELAEARELAELGPDPFTPGYRYEPFHEALQHSNSPVKALLLGQKLVAGVGNIYADEALFRAGLRPGRRSATLTRPQTRRLFEAVREVLKIGIENRGTTFSDYRDAGGEPGGNQDCLQVYGRYGLPCPKCGQTLHRSTVAGRTSTWCARCQS